MLNFVFYLLIAATSCWPAPEDYPRETSELYPNPTDLLGREETYSYYEQDDDEDLPANLTGLPDQTYLDDEPTGLSISYSEYNQYETTAMYASEAVEKYQPHDDGILMNVTDLPKISYTEYDDPVLRQKKRKQTLYPTPRVYRYFPRNKNNPIPQYNTSNVLPTRNMTFIPHPLEMGYLYRAAPIIMDAIVPHQKQDFVEQVVADLFSVSQYEVKVKPAGLYKLSVLLAGPLIFIIFFLTIAVLLPVAAKSAYYLHKHPRKQRRPFDRKCDCHLKCCLITLFLSLMALYVLSVIGAFMAERQMEDAVDNLAAIVCNMTRTVSKELQRTTRFIWRRHDPKKGVPAELSINETDTFHRILNSYYTNIKLKPLKSSLRSLSSIVSGLDDVRRDLRDVHHHGAMLWFLADKLNAGLRKVKRDLLRALTTCDLSICVELQRKHHIEELNTNIPYTPIPDVSQLLKNVTSLINTQIKEDVAHCRRSLHDTIVRFNKIKKQMIVYHTEDIDEALDIQGRLGYEFHNAMWFWLPSLYNTLEGVEEYRKKFEDNYAPFIRYVAFSSVVITPIPIVLVLGWPWGLLGRRASADGSLHFCSRGIGSLLLYCAMVLVIALLTVYCAATVLFFIIGVFIQRGICDPFQEPLNSAMFRMVDQFVDLENSVFKEDADYTMGFNVSRVLVDCYHWNGRRRMYEVFHIMRMMDMPRVQFFLKKPAWEGHIKKKMPPVTPTKYPVLLRESAKRKLLRLADTRFMDLDIDRIPAALKTNVYRHSTASRQLLALARALQRAAAGVARSGGYGAVPAELRAAARRLDELRLNIIAPMLQHAQALNVTAHCLNQSRRLGVSHTSLKRGITELVNEVSRGEKFINKNLDRIIRQANKRLEGYAATYVVKTVYRHVVPHAMPHDQFLVVPIESTYLAVCHHLLLPIHGIWICMASCVLLLLPLLLVTRNLARLFRHTDPYPGPSVVRAYDAYKQFKRETNKRRRRGGEDLQCGGVCNAVIQPPHTPQLPPLGDCHF